MSDAVQIMITACFETSVIKYILSGIQKLDNNKLSITWIPDVFGTRYLGYVYVLV